MLSKFVDKLMELSEPHTFNTDTGEYADKKVIRIPNELRAAPLTVYSLDGLAGYLQKFMPAEKKYFVQVVSPTLVRVISDLDSDREREILVEAVAEVPQIPFGKFLDNEAMIIAMQSMFTEEETLLGMTDRYLVLKFAGTDDGITQKATVKDGIISKAEAIVPNPCTLRPFRTFTEVEQPASQFIFRMREDGDKRVLSALFEADGGAWKREARMNIADYLRGKMDDLGITDIPVIC